MSARDEILARVRRHRPDERPLPDPARLEAVQFDDLAGRFAQSLESVGGVCVAADSPDRVSELLHADGHGVRTVVSTVPGVPGIQPADQRDRPDLTVARGSLAVAENGAVWVDGRQFAHQSALFLAEHLVLVVERASLVANLHQAYARIDAADLPAYGVFVSGPSKTADIEQTLVIGAQGPRSCRVILVG